MNCKKIVFILLVWPLALCQAKVNVMDYGTKADGKAG